MTPRRKRIVEFAVIRSSRTGELVGRVRLDAPDAPQRMAQMVKQAEGAVCVSVEEGEVADASGNIPASFRRAAAAAINRSRKSESRRKAYVG